LGVGTWNGSAYTGLTGLIASGRNGGAWNGSGIVTSMTDAVGAGALTSVGIATAGAVAKTTFGGVSVGADDVLLMYTYAGDANLDGKVSISDYGKLDFNINIPGAFGWSNGDFNYDGKVSISDYGIIDFVIGIQGPQFPAIGGTPTDMTTVPEPMSLALFVACGFCSLTRRRPRSAPARSYTSM
jgi:hypothetical protein